MSRALDVSHAGLMAVYTSDVPLLCVVESGLLVLTINAAKIVNTTQFGLVLVYDLPALLTAEAGLITVFNMPVVETACAGVMAVYTENVAVPRNAWGFTFDGHPFYALTLETQGTFLYDVTTEQWSEWKTEGFVGWNARNGTQWRNKTVAGSANSSSVWRIAPEASVDEGWRTINRVVTGIYPARGRDSMRNYSLRVTASVGNTYTLDTINDILFDDSTMTLRISDDNGETWFNCGTVDLQAEDFMQELAWRSLGRISAPGRIFEISDTGGLVRIDDVEADIEEKPGDIPRGAR